MSPHLLGVLGGSLGRLELEKEVVLLEGAEGTGTGRASAGHAAEGAHRHLARVVAAGQGVGTAQ